MQNNKKQDKLYVNRISPGNEVKNISRKPAGNAEDDPFCVYAHQRHAAGSKLVMDKGGPEAVCKDDGTWQNK